MEESIPNEMEQNIENELNTDENIPGTEHLNEPVADEDPITKLEAELQEQKDKYLRLMAEFDNYRRRTSKERLELIQTAGKDGVAVGWVGANDQNNIGFFYRIKVLGACRGAKRLAKAIAGGRMADPRAGIRIIVHKDSTRQLLHQIGFFVGAARRGDHADRVAPMIGNDALHAVRGKLHRLGPRHFFPRIVDAVADHRAKDAVFVASIAVSKAALHA